jgi:putative oxidoreductase
MRIAVGSVFFNADPTLMARKATFNELMFSTLLFLGLATRLATLPFLGMIVVIQTFVYPNAWIEHLVWSGGGALSLDHLIARRLGATHQ